eukprot:8704556-Pyramimonas_sp.AAC.1
MLHKHDSSQRRKSSVCALLGQQPLTSSDGGAPSEAMFKQVLNDRKALKSYAEGSQDVGAKAKVARVT